MPKRRQLAKRLSQCLSESLPTGIHSTALSIYTLIFEGLQARPDRITADIHLYSFGLFPFFAKGSLQVKPEALALFRRFYLPLGAELVPLLSGLTLAVLPALEEQDGELQRLVWEFLAELSACAGERFFLEAVWKGLMRSAGVREACLKLLHKKCAEGAGEELIADEQTTLEALRLCLRGGEVTVQKACLDLLARHDSWD